MSNLQDKRFRNTVTGNTGLIDHGGNHFVNGKCVNPVGVIRSEQPLKYKEVRDEDGNVVGYRATNRESVQLELLSTTYPRAKDVEFFKVLGHIPLEARGDGKNEHVKMFVKRGFEHLLN